MNSKTKKVQPKSASAAILQAHFKKLRIKPQDIRDAVAWARGKKKTVKPS